ncbi:MAG: hypothetical protein WC269_03820 [Candidatus Gracilibacteria bacterium]|jgi:hypothetical protein
MENLGKGVFYAPEGGGGGREIFPKGEADRITAMVRAEMGGRAGVGSIAHLVIEESRSPDSRMGKHLGFGLGEPAGVSPRITEPGDAPVNQDSEPKMDGGDDRVM